MPKLPPHIEKMLRKNRKRFIRKFGREPGPEDPLFWDPDAEVPTPLGEAKFDAMMLDAMQKAGTPPSLVYAYMKTGRILTEEGRANLTEAEQAEWDAAIEEYYELEERAAARRQ